MANIKERIVIEAVDNTTRGMRSAQNKLSALERLVTRVQTTLLGFVGINIFSGLVSSAARASDSVIELDAKLKLVTESSEEFKEAQQELLNISLESGSSLEANATLFTRLNRSIKAAGGTTQETLEITKFMAEALRLSGASAQESTSVIRQFSQAMASGVLRGEEFNAIMENGGRVAIALSDGLGVSIGRLREMSKAGELTADVVRDALSTQFETVSEEAAKLPLTIGRALENVKSKWLTFLKDFGAGNEIFANGIASLGDLIEPLVSAIGLLVKATAVYLALRIPATIGGWVQSLRALVIQKQADAALSKQQAVLDKLTSAAKTDLISRTHALNAAASEEIALKIKKAVADKENLAREQAIATVKARVALATAKQSQAIAAAEQLRAAAAVEALKAEAALEQVRLKAQISDKGRQLSLTRLATLQRELTIATTQATAADKALAASKHQVAAATTAHTATIAANTAALGANTLASGINAKAAGASAVASGLMAGKLGKAFIALRGIGGYLVALLPRIFAFLTGPWGIALYVAFEALNAYLDDAGAFFDIVISKLEKFLTILGNPVDFLTGTGDLQAKLNAIDEELDRKLDQRINDKIARDQGFADHEAKLLADKEARANREISSEQRKINDLTALQEKYTADFARFERERDAARNATGGSLEDRQAELDRIEQLEKASLSQRIANEEDYARAVEALEADTLLKKEQAATQAFQVEQAALEVFYQEQFDATQDDAAARKLVIDELVKYTKESYGERLDALYATLDDSVKAERAASQQIKDLQQGIVDKKEDYANQVREITGAVVSSYEERKRVALAFESVRSKLAEAASLDAKKDAERIAELTSEAKTEALELAKSQKKIADDAKESGVERAQAELKVQEALALSKKALDAEIEADNNLIKQVEINKNKHKTAIEEKRKSIQELQGDLEKITKELAQEKILAIKADADQAFRQFDKVQIALANIKDKVVTVTVVTKNVQAAQTGGFIHKFASGGYIPRKDRVPGSGSGDKVKALLEPGEYIIRKEAVRKYGSAFMERVNGLAEPIRRKLGGPIPKYATGGFVSGSSNTPTFALSRSGTIPARIEVDTDQLQEALFAIETKVKEQIEEAQQRFNESALATTDRAADAVSKSLERYTEAIGNIQSDTLRFDESIEDRIRNIRRAGFTEEEQRIDIIKQIREKQAAAEQAIAEGDLERAARLNGELIALAESISVEAKDAAGNVIVSQQDAANQAIGFLNTAKTLNAQIAAQKQTLVGSVRDTELAAIEATKNAELAAIQATLDAKLAAIAKEQAASIKTTTSSASVSSSGSGFSSGSVSSSGSTSDSTARTTSAIQREIDNLKSSLGNFSTFGITAYQTDMLKKLNALYAELKASSGFNTGGSVPGVGNSDTVRAMLTPGEFVIKKASVAKYGQGFLSAINEGVLPATRRFASGGAVSQVKETIALNLNIGGNQATGEFEDNDSTRALIDALNEASLVS